MLQPCRTDPPADPVDAWQQIRAMIDRAPRLNYEDFDTGRYMDDRRSYETEKKRLTRARCAALAALEDAAGRPYDRAALAYACAHSYSGRITWQEDGQLDYCAGQHAGTERRFAALAVLRCYLDLINGPSFTLGRDGRIYTQPQGHQETR